MAKTGWHDETRRVPPDNREAVMWSYYGPPTEISGTTFDNTIAIVAEYDKNRWAVRVVGPTPRDKGRRAQAASLDLMNTTLEDAKEEAECLLRDLGWVMETAIGEPEESNPPL